MTPQRSFAILVDLRRRRSNDHDGDVTPTFDRERAGQITLALCASALDSFEKRNPAVTNLLSPHPHFTHTPCSAGKIAPRDVRLWRDSHSGGNVGARGRAPLCGKMSPSTVFFGTRAAQGTTTR